MAVLIRFHCCRSIIGMVFQSRLCVFVVYFRPIVVYEMFLFFSNAILAQSLQPEDTPDGMKTKKKKIKKKNTTPFVKYVHMYVNDDMQLVSVALVLQFACHFGAIKCFELTFCFDASKNQKKKKRNHSRNTTRSQFLIQSPVGNVGILIISVTSWFFKVGISFYHVMRIA